MSPKPGHRSSRHGIIVVSSTVVTEDSKLVLCHHICTRRGLDPAPDVIDTPFKHHCYCWRDLTILIVFRYFERLGQGELGCG